MNNIEEIDKDAELIGFDKKVLDIVKEKAKKNRLVQDDLPKWMLTF